MEIEENDITTKTAYEIYGMSCKLRNKPINNKYNHPCVTCGNLILTHSFNIKNCEECNQ